VEGAIPNAPIRAWPVGEQSTSPKGQSASFFDPRWVVVDPGGWQIGLTGGAKLTDVQLRPGECVVVTVLE
jgi:hypothetical protein